MDAKEKLLFFESNITEIFDHDTNELVSFLAEVTDKSKLIKSFEAWPDEFKINIVDRYLEVKK